MTDANTTDLQAIAAQALRFAHSLQTLQLATCNAQGVPEASYAPFVEHEGQYCIYVSELAAHCANLQASGRCAALFIESEADAKTPFARQRLSLHCTAAEVPRGSADFDAVMQRFHAKFGKFMQVIGGLLDFHLYHLTPTHGGYVAGFGKAYALGGERLVDIRWRNEQGHRSPDQKTSAAMDALLE